MLCFSPGGLTLTVSIRFNEAWEGLRADRLTCCGLVAQLGLLPHTTFPSSLPFLLLHTSKEMALKPQIKPMLWVYSYFFRFTLFSNWHEQIPLIITDMVDVTMVTTGAICTRVPPCGLDAKECNADFRLWQQWSLKRKTCLLFVMLLLMNGYFIGEKTYMITTSIW